MLPSSNNGIFGISLFRNKRWKYTIYIIVLVLYSMVLTILIAFLLLHFTRTLITVFSGIKNTKVRQLFPVGT